MRSSDAVAAAKPDRAAAPSVGVRDQRRSEGRSSAVQSWLGAALLIIAATLLGGASRENAIRLAVVELCALPLMVVAVRDLVLSGRSEGRVDCLPLALLVLIAAIPLLQSIPLPPDLWASLPGQSPRSEALRLAGLSPKWLPLSLSPEATGRAELALIPPEAMFLGVMRLEPSALRRLVWLWIGLAAVGLLLGVVQIAAPSGGPAYLYATTNLGSLVGLFANRNHEAGFLLALLPFAAALMSAPKRASGSPAQSLRRLSGAWMAGPFILISIVALGVIRSRAGVILAAPAALAALAVAWRGRRTGRGSPQTVIALLMAIAALAVALFGLAPIVGRFGQESHEFRFEAWPHVITAAKSYQPLGSGLGSFSRVFEAVEPLSLVGPAWFNHAHNDYLELWLETGWLGAAVFALFMAWLLPAAWRAWRSGRSLAQAASASILLLLALSGVDYPLRTETLAVLFAFCCALLARRPGQ